MMYVMSEHNYRGWTLWRTPYNHCQSDEIFTLDIGDVVLIDRSHTVGMSCLALVRGVVGWVSLNIVHFLTEVKL